MTDKGSSNGSFVNDERVESALIEDGDQIRFGSVRNTLLLVERGPLTYVADGIRNPAPGNYRRPLGHGGGASSFPEQSVLNQTSSKYHSFRHCTFSS